MGNERHECILGYGLSPTPYTIIGASLGRTKIVSLELRSLIFDLKKKIEDDKRKMEMMEEKMDEDKRKMEEVMKEKEDGRR